MDGSGSQSAKRRKVNHSDDILRFHPNVTTQLSASISDDQEDQCGKSAEFDQDGPFPAARGTGISHRPSPQQSPAVMSPSCGSTKNDTTMLPSPFKLTYVPGLPREDNVDAVRLTDLLGDPLIKEAWQFNFMFDLDFLMCVNLTFTI